MSFNKSADDPTFADEHPGAVLAATGAATASPFLGLIGQKKIVNDPHLNDKIKRMRLSDMERMAQPGDVILSSRPGWEGFKVTQAPFSGTEFFHASPVTSRWQGKGEVIDAGEAIFPGAPNYRIPEDELTSHAKRVGIHFPEEGYGDLVLMRPGKGLTPAQQKRYTEELAKRMHNPYSVAKGVKATLKDLFVPKLRNPSSAVADVDAVRGCNSGSQMCSSLPSEAHHAAGTAQNISKGKLPSQVLPADFMREGSGFNPVGAVLKQEKSLSTPLQRAAYRYGGRGLLGLGMGTAVYNTSEDPVATTSALAGLGAPLALRAILKKRLKQENPRIGSRKLQQEVDLKLPSVIKTLRLGLMRDPYLSEQSKKLIKRRLFTRTLPASLAAGVGVYGLTNLIKNRLEGPQVKKAADQDEDVRQALRTAGNTERGLLSGALIGGGLLGVAAMRRKGLLSDKLFHMHRNKAVSAKEYAAAMSKFNKMPGGITAGSMGALIGAPIGGSVGLLASLNSPKDA
jgi:hypothetical protein